jgi:ANTAR domain
MDADTGTSAYIPELRSLCRYRSRARPSAHSTPTAAWVAVAVGNAEAAARTRVDLKTREDLNHFRIAMMSRAYIEQSKGILMERHKIKEDEAFSILYPRLPTNQPEAARRGRRAGPDRRGAQHRFSGLRAGLSGPALSTSDS